MLKCEEQSLKSSGNITVFIFCKSNTDDLSLQLRNEVLNMDSTIEVRVVNESKSKLYASMTEEEMLARLKKSREQECRLCNF